jgi:uncharacterized protein (TIGR03435 family)
MANKAAQFIYRCIVNLHPAEFRDKFGREMLLDFQEGAAGLGCTRFFTDALISLGRQWLHTPASVGFEPRSDASPLLNGHYAMIRNPPLTPLEWCRGLVASVTLLVLCGYWLGAGSRIPRDTGIVYAARKVAQAAQSRPPASPDESSATPAAVRRDFKQFDVASVRESKAGTTYVSFPFGADDTYLPTHGFMQMIGLPLGAYIQFAYKMTPAQIVALETKFPDWALSTRYDIEARVEGEPTKDDMRTMLRALLADRFKLQLHAVTATDKVYDLVLARPGKTGPALQEHPGSDPDCKLDSARDSAHDSSAPCGTILQSVSGAGLMRMTGRNVSITQFVLASLTKVDRPLRDKTGLTGKYDFTFDFAPPRIGGGPDINASEPQPGMTFKDAMQDRLGLKLVPDKGPVTTYVLDHVEKPTEN